MKKALKLAVIYLIILVAGTVVGTVLYSLYLNLISYITGKDIKFFTDAELFNSFFYVLFSMLLFVGPSLAYYRIRHPGGVLQLVVYIALYVCTWIFVVPVSLQLKDFCVRHFPQKVSSQYLTPNYFRQVDDNVYFFTKEFFVSSESGSDGIPQASAVVISTKEDGVVEYKNVKSENLDVIKKAEPYREIQLKRLFGEERNPIPVDFRVLINNIAYAYSGAGLSYLLTLFSLIFLLCSLYSVTIFFDWRLLNAVFLFIFTAAILCFNSIYYVPEYSWIKEKLARGGLINFTAKFVSEPVLFISNCVCALIFTSIGIIKFFIRRFAAKSK